MRRPITWVVTAGLVLVGLAAVIDVFWDRAESSAPRERPRETTGPDSPAIDFERAGVSGSLFLTVKRGQVCEIRVVELPAARVSTSTGLAACRFEVSPDGRNIAEARDCPGGPSPIRDALLADISRSFVGCAPAWKPDGTLTYVRGGEVVSEDLDCLARVGCATVVLSKQDVDRGPRAIAGRLGHLSLAGLAWLSDSRLAAIVHSPRLDSYSVALFEGRKRFEFIELAFRAPPQFDAVPGAKEIIMGASGPFLTFDRRGRVVGSPSRIPFSDVMAVAASPDGRWLALARRGNVCIYAARNGRPPVECIPGDAVDLAWR